MIEIRTLNWYITLRAMRGNADPELLAPHWYAIKVTGYNGGSGEYYVQDKTGKSIGIYNFNTSEYQNSFRVCRCYLVKLQNPQDNLGFRLVGKVYEIK